MTARHVVSEAFGLDEKDGVPALTYDEHGTIEVLYLSEDIPSGHSTDLLGGPLPVTHCWFNNALDIALMKVKLPMEIGTEKLLRMPAQILSPGIPDVGQKCMGIGYHAMTWNNSIEGRRSLSQDFSATSGVIEEVHFPQRDSSSLRFPCCRTSARFDRGMSGGPVFSERGQIWGVVCSGFDMAAEQSGYTSYVSLITPALGIMLDAMMPTGQRKVFLHELIDGGAVAVDATYHTIQFSRSQSALDIRLPNGPQVRIDIA
jgi:hypothetical protein